LTGFENCVIVFKQKGELDMNKIQKQLEDAGYDNAVAVATKAENEAGAALGQHAIINERFNERGA